jgi:hypothetical protein
MSAIVVAHRGSAATFGSALKPNRGAPDLLASPM